MGERRASARGGRKRAPGHRTGSWPLAGARRGARRRRPPRGAGSAAGARADPGLGPDDRGPGPGADHPVRPGRCADRADTAHDPDDAGSSGRPQAQRAIGAQSSGSRESPRPLDGGGGGAALRALVAGDPPGRPARPGVCRRHLDRRAGAAVGGERRRPGACRHDPVTAGAGRPCGRRLPIQLQLSRGCRHSRRLIRRGRLTRSDAPGPRNG